MKLIGSLGSPFVRKVRIVIAEKKLDIALVLEDVWSDHTKIHALNPLGKIPCLILDDDSTLFDSAVIVDYLDAQTTDNCLIPAINRHVIKCWEALADGVLDAGVLIRLESVLRPEALRSDDWVARQMLAVKQGIKMMSDRLGSQTYCVNNQFSLADIAVVSALNWLSFRNLPVNWQDEHPNLADLCARLSSRPSFKNTFPQ